jgi:glycolate oxidase
MDRGQCAEKLNGYNFTQLMVGSEGTLGIVTKVVLKLVPHPKFTLVMLAPFPSMEKAAAAVAATFQAGIVPSCMEFMERDAIDWVCKWLGDVTIPIADDVRANLLIELDGNDMDVLYKESEKLYEVLTGFDCGRYSLLTLMRRRRTCGGCAAMWPMLSKPLQ